MARRSKSKPSGPGRPGTTPPRRSQNAKVNAQSRRVLVQHYRAKHGVK